MSIPPQPPEDLQLMDVFYPDPAVRHRIHYTFAHRFIPSYVWQNPYAFFAYVAPGAPGFGDDPTQFIRSRWWAYGEDLGPPPISKPDTVPFIADLSMSLHPLGQRTVALIKMPPAKQPGEAIYVAVVLEGIVGTPSATRENARARILNLEREGNHPAMEEGFLCEWTPAGHGIRARSSSEPTAFLKALEVVLNETSPKQTDTKPAPLPISPQPSSHTRSAPAETSSPTAPAEKAAAKPWWRFWA